MIKKIILFGDFSGRDLEDSSVVDYIFFKSAAVLRIGYLLRKEGFEVKQIHHCTSFNRDELRKLITDFSDGERALICVSSSFLAGAIRTEVGETISKESVHGEFWGKDAFAFLLNVGLIAKENAFPLILGGFEVTRYKFEYKQSRKWWGLDYLDRFVSYYVEGNDVSVIADICKGITPGFETVNGSKIITTPEVFDFTDCASTALPEDNILDSECLITEVAAGCVFSCSFCNYAALGKKKNEYVRTYESLKQEIVSNYENFGTTVYMLTDNIMNDFHEKLKYLVRIREETNIDFRWIGYARLDVIQTREHAQLIKDSGAAAIIFGIESMTKDVGPTIGKMTDRNRIIACLKLFREVVDDEVLVSASLIAGAPKERIEDIKKTHEWLISEEGQHYIDHYRFIPFYLQQGLDDRNEINKARNNPFKDYTFSNREDEIKGINWTSPWGTFQEFYDFAVIANKRAEMDHAKHGPFFLPILYNVSDYSISDITRMIRNKENVFDKHVSEYAVNNAKYINDYKRRMLS